MHPWCCVWVGPLASVTIFRLGTTCLCAGNIGWGLHQLAYEAGWRWGGVVCGMLCPSLRLQRVQGAFCLCGGGIAEAASLPGCCGCICCRNVFTSYAGVVCYCQLCEWRHANSRCRRPGAVWQVFPQQHFGRVYVVHSACKLLWECVTCAVLRLAVRRCLCLIVLFLVCLVDAQHHRERSGVYRPSSACCFLLTASTATIAASCSATFWCRRFQLLHSSCAAEQPGCCQQGTLCCRYLCTFLLPALVCAALMVG